MTTKIHDDEVQPAFDQILGRIIDEWYDNVCSYYITREQIEANPDLASQEEELKRFHDDSGHRIKFGKDELDFTYGLRCRWDGDEAFVIEVSVNNKVPRFDYDDFQRRLTDHYQKTGQKTVPTPYELKSHSFQEVFEFRPNLRDAFVVETREGKADIMRLSFWVNTRYLEKLSSHPIAGKQLVEQYCVSPFRSVYAAVYRKSR